MEEHLIDFKLERIEGLNVEHCDELWLLHCRSDLLLELLLDVAAVDVNVFFQRFKHLTYVVAENCAVDEIFEWFPCVVCFVKAFP